MESETNAVGRRGSYRKLYLETEAYNALKAKADKWGKSMSELTSGLMRLLAGIANESDDWLRLEIASSGNGVGNVDVPSRREFNDLLAEVASIREIVSSLQKRPSRPRS